MSLNIAAGLGLGGNESYPDLFQPYGGFPDGVKVDNGYVTLPALPGIGFEGKADLIAIARELMYNPNWAMDAAQKLGADPDFVGVPPALGWWLGKRAKSAFEGVPSTYKRGAMADVE